MGGASRQSIPLPPRFDGIFLLKPVSFSPHYNHRSLRVPASIPVKTVGPLFPRGNLFQLPVKNLEVCGTLLHPGRGCLAHGRFLLVVSGQNHIGFRPGLLPAFSMTR